VIPAGRVDKQTALAGVDVFPTLLAATGAKPPQGYVSDGENMISALKGQPQTRTRPVFWWWQGGHSGDDWPAFAMRDGAWVLILDETKERNELYNVLDDRTQSKNLTEEQPERVARMRSEIEKWIATLPKSVDASLQSKAITFSFGASGQTSRESRCKPRHRLYEVG
jgi:N-acetylgalactosamine-6-sulfatase